MLRTGIELQDNFSTMLYGIVNSVNFAVSAMYDMQQAMNADIDIASLEGAREQINEATMSVNELNAALANMGNPQMPAAPAAPAWTNQSNIQVFDDTGVQRLTNEMSSLNNISDEVFRSQQRIDEQALGMDILPPNASWDINATNQRIMDLSQRLQNLQGQDINLLGDSGAEQMNSQYEHIRANMNSIVNLQAQLDQAIQENDVSGLNRGYNQLNNIITQVEQQARAAQQTMNNLTNIEWNSSGGLEVFTGSGIDRFRQEIQSTNTMMSQLNTTQQLISQTARGMNILPDTAIQDINSIGTRIQAIRQRISQIEANPINMGTDTANAQLEQLRTQLNRAVQEQNHLNAALNNMDVSAANASYMRLSQMIGGTERYIRDNVDEQGRFNQEIQQGVTQSNELAAMIKQVAAAYISIHTVGNILNISDELTQSTARINLMNDGLQTTEELTNMIYASAQNARGSFSDMTAVIARFGNNAKDAFGSSEEVVAFANLVQKQMTIAGASTSEASNAMLQLSQALGSGVLRGDELNSIFENAPNLIQNIADYLDVPIGEIREMASEGELSADVVKEAIFAASDDINTQFESMPVTWAQAWTNMKNAATMAFQPVLEKLNDIANSETFQVFLGGVIEAMQVISNMILNAFDLIGQFGSFIVDNWSIISPIIYGVVAALAVYYGWQLAINAIGLISKGIHMGIAVAQMIHAAMTRKLTTGTAAQIAAQNGLNAALYACPIVWIIVGIIAIIAVIYAVVAAINKATGSTISATGIICGSIATAAAFIWDIILGVINAVIGIGIELYNLIASFANFFANVFNDPVSAIINLFADMFDFILGIVSSAASLIDTVLGSDLSGAVEGFRDDFSDAVSEIVGDQTVVVEKLNASDYQLDRISYGDAWNAGYEFGEGIDDKISDFSLSDFLGKTEIPDPEDYAYVFDGSNTESYLSNISDSTEDISDSLDITEEDLKYLRDLAEQETVNRYTVAEISIDQSGMKNTINGTNDLDGFVSGLTDAVNEAAGMITEGVHY